MNILDRKEYFTKLECSLHSLEIEAKNIKVHREDYRLDYMFKTMCLSVLMVILSFALKEMLRNILLISCSLIVVVRAFIFKNKFYKLSHQINLINKEIRKIDYIRKVCK